MAHTRADVIATALRVLDANGLEFTSMRRVATALDVQPSALYHHVPNKQTLLALMADEIVRDVVSMGQEDPAALCYSLRHALLSVRDGADVVATASAFRLGASEVEARLAELVGADGARTLLLYTFGQAQATQTQMQAAELGALPPEALRAGALPKAADPLAASAVPSESHSATALVSLEAELARGFAHGIAIILRGLA